VAPWRPPFILDRSSLVSVSIVKEAEGVDVVSWVNATEQELDRLVAKRQCLPRVAAPYQAKSRGSKEAGIYKEGASL